MSSRDDGLRMQKMNCRIFMGRRKCRKHGSKLSEIWTLDLRIDLQVIGKILWSRMAFVEMDWTKRICWYMVYRLVLRAIECLTIRERVLHKFFGILVSNT